MTTQRTPKKNKPRALLEILQRPRVLFGFFIAVVIFAVLYILLSSPRYSYNRSTGLSSGSSSGYANPGAWYGPLRTRMSRLNTICTTAQKSVWGSGASLFMAKTKAYCGMILDYPQKMGKLEGLLQRIRSKGRDIRKLLAEKEQKTMSLGTKEDITAVRQYLGNHTITIHISQELTYVDRYTSAVEDEAKSGKVRKENIKLLYKQLEQIHRKFEKAYQPISSMLTHFAMQ